MQMKYLRTMRLSTLSKVIQTPTLAPELVPRPLLASHCRGLGGAKKGIPVLRRPVSCAGRRN